MNLLTGAAYTWDASKTCVLPRYTAASTYVATRGQIQHQGLDSRGPPAHLSGASRVCAASMSHRPRPQLLPSAASESTKLILCMPVYVLSQGVTHLTNGCA
jgi:hypothetical protein